MAKTKITNTAEGPRGVNAKDGTTVYVDPGQTAEVELADGEELYDGLVEGDGGLDALKKADLIALAEAEGVPIETDDNRSDLIRKIEEGRAARA